MNDTVNLHVEEVDDDWEEWDGKSPFWIHCVAGSLAGVVEHGTVYPLDTVRTHLQVCADCVVNKASSSVNSAASAGANSATTNSNYKSSLLGNLYKNSTNMAAANNKGMWQTIRHLMNETATVSAVGATMTATTSSAETSKSITQTAGFSRLWRGSTTILVGCVPAHALYFGSYELVKHKLSNSSNTSINSVALPLAGASAVFCHDLVMTPLDTLKQRLQLGHYINWQAGLSQIIQQEGWTALYRSFGVTLLANVPYGAIMVTTNEYCKTILQKYYNNNNNNNNATTINSWQVVAPSSAMAGCAAAALTTPLDRVKTLLQTQQLQPQCVKTCPKLASACNAAPIFTSWQQAAKHVYTTQGIPGFFKGTIPRVLSHTPAVAISWTTYETAKQFLLVSST